MTKKEKLLDRDIHDRFAYEKKFAKDPDDQKQTGKGAQIAIAIGLAVIVLGSLLYPLLTEWLG